MKRIAFALGALVGLVAGILISPALNVRLVLWSSRNVRDLTWRDHQEVESV